MDNFEKDSRGNRKHNNKNKRNFKEQEKLDFILEKKRLQQMKQEEKIKEKNEE